MEPLPEKKPKPSSWTPRHETMFQQMWQRKADRLNGPKPRITEDTLTELNMTGIELIPERNMQTKRDNLESMYRRFKEWHLHPVVREIHDREQLNNEKLNNEKSNKKKSRNKDSNISNFFTKKKNIEELFEKKSNKKKLNIKKLNKKINKSTIRDLYELIGSEPPVFHVLQTKSKAPLRSVTVLPLAKKIFEHSVPKSAETSEDEMRDLCNK